MVTHLTKITELKIETMNPAHGLSHHCLGVVGALLEFWMAFMF